MVHVAFIAAGQALDAGAQSVGATTATVAVVTLLLGVVAMFALLFWTRWGDATGADPTAVVEQDRHQRLNQNPVYS